MFGTMTPTSLSPEEQGHHALPLADVLDSRTAALLLQVHVTTVQELARRGEIPCRKVGKDYRFLKIALIAWLQGTASQSATYRRRAR